MALCVSIGYVGTHGVDRPASSVGAEVFPRTGCPTLPARNYERTCKTCCSQRRPKQPFQCHHRARRVELTVVEKSPSRSCLQNLRLARSTDSAIIPSVTSLRPVPHCCWWPEGLAELVLRQIPWRSIVPWLPVTVVMRPGCC